VFPLQVNLPSAPGPVTRGAADPPKTPANVCRLLPETTAAGLVEAGAALLTTGVDATTADEAITAVEEAPLPPMPPFAVVVATDAVVSPVAMDVARADEVATEATDVVPEAMAVALAGPATEEAPLPPLPPFAGVVATDVVISVATEATDVVPEAMTVALARTATDEAPLPPLPPFPPPLATLAVVGGTTAEVALAATLVAGGVALTAPPAPPAAALTVK